MYLCYIDESGTADIPGNTSHFVLAGLSIPIWAWKDCDRQIEAIKRKYGLLDREIHVGWILRAYLEQSRVRVRFAARLTRGRAGRCALGFLRVAVAADIGSTGAAPEPLAVQVGPVRVDHVAGNALDIGAAAFSADQSGALHCADRAVLGM